MDRRFHAVSFIVSRAILWPDFLTISRRKGWFVDFTEAAAETEWDEALPEASIPRLGALLPQPPQRTYAASQYPSYQHSGIRAEPFYVRCNWRIKAVKLPADAALQFRMRLRFYEHGGASCALFGQLLCDRGLAQEEIVTLLRGLVDSDGHSPLALQWRSAGKMNEGSAGELMEQALSLLATSVLAKPSQVARQELDPDHLTVDIGRTTPPVVLDGSDSDLLRILALTSDKDRRIRHKREPDLGLFDYDWVAASTKQLLFCNTKTPWPEERHWRSLRRTGRRIWQFYRVAEIARTRLLWARHLANTFEASSLQMTRAQNLSRNFVANLLKATYYDDRLYTLAADLRQVKAEMEFHSRDKLLYGHLAGLIGLDKELARLETAAKRFMSQVESWSPSITKFIDLFKIIG
ncbi:MAG TPA: hypothetical protein VNA44_06775 [Burkholderiaceae bacterium]|nr:hypothetical protein [Burkholderiaceae bacterium]